MRSLPADIERTLIALRTRLVDSGMPAPIARLYAQFSRLREQQTSLPSWSAAEAAQRFDEALQLLDLALEARARDDSTWRASARRAGELLEWLAQPGVFATDAPLHLLAGAVYQFAGYPARALGLLRSWPRAEESAIIHAFLRGDFVALLDELSAYWSSAAAIPRDGVVVPPRLESAEALPQQVAQDVAGAFGLMCAALRWGDVGRLDLAIAKMDAITQLMLHSRNRYSSLISELCAEAMREYAQSALRIHCAPLSARLGPNGQQALERYVRLAFAGNHALTWPSQVRGYCPSITLMDRL